MQVYLSGSRGCGLKGKTSGGFRFVYFGGKKSAIKGATNSMEMAMLNNNGTAVGSALFLRCHRAVRIL